MSHAIRTLDRVGPRRSERSRSHEYRPSASTCGIVVIDETPARIAEGCADGDRARFCRVRADRLRAPVRRRRGRARRRARRVGCGTGRGRVRGERSSDARIAVITCAFAAPGVGLEPTTYGLTVRCRSSVVIHHSPPSLLREPMASASVRPRPRQSAGSAVMSASGPRVA